MTSGSRAARGSSNKTILGLLIITLAIINLLISPPDKTDAFKDLKCCRLNSSNNFSVISFCFFLEINFEHLCYFAADFYLVIFIGSIINIHSLTAVFRTEFLSTSLEVKETTQRNVVSWLCF